MKIVEINAVPYGSTGKIAKQIAQVANMHGHEAVFACSWTKIKKNHMKKDEMLIGSFLGKSLHIALAKLTGFSGYFGVIDTLLLIRKLKKFQPDILHLHILHSWCVNLPLLFRYIKKHDIKVVWTMHDCWAFTGQCPHFTMAKCDKWKDGCYSCPQYRQYPQSYVDLTRFMWKKKKEWFTGVKDMTIVTPSHWLAGLVRESFLRDYPVKVIHNGIDLSVFKPTESVIREKYHCENKHVLLGVSFDWGKRKGLDVFIELAKRLSDSYQIVLVGTDDTIDQQLPPNIISIHRTQNQEELAAIYSSADIFVNPTREEVLGLVNIEALACGTPVLTFATGGSPEVAEESCGSVVACDDVDGMEREILRICEERPYSAQACIDRAKSFDMGLKFKEYIDLYNAESQAEFDGGR